MGKKQFSIEAVFKAIDKFSNPLKGINKKTNQFSRALRTDFAKAQKKVKAFSQSFKANIGRGLAIGAGLALAAVAKLTKESLKLWDAQAMAIANVDATLKSTGGSVGRSLKQLEAQASSLQKNTFFGDEDILQGVTAQMLTFTSITGTQFERAQGVVLDMTAKLKGLDAGAGDLKGTTLMLSKALNDPISNLSAMSRSGVQFTQVQKDMIKALAKGGDMAGAQNIILDELEKQYGGTAAALSKTAKGMEISFNNLRGDKLEEIGKALEPLRMKFLQFRIDALEKLSPMINQLTEYLTKNSDAIGAKFYTAMDKATKITKTFFKIIAKAYKIIKPLTPAILAVVAAIMAYKVVMIATAIVTEFLTKVSAAYAAVMKVVAFAEKISLGTRIQLLALTIQQTAATIAHKVASFAAVVATKAMTAAQWLLNIAMDANPIGLVILALGALIAFMTVAIKKYDEFGALMMNGSIASQLYNIYKNWTAITAAFEKGGVIAGVSAIIQSATMAMTDAIIQLLTLLEKIPNIGGKFSSLKGVFSNFKESTQSNINKWGNTDSAQTGNRMQQLYAPTQRSESVSRGEVVIKDETGRAEMPSRPTGSGFDLSLQSSGAM